VRRSHGFTLINVLLYFINRLCSVCVDFRIYIYRYYYVRLLIEMVVVINPSELPLRGVHGCPARETALPNLVRTQKNLGQRRNYRRAQQIGGSDES
jgi:hypothetical protein